MALPFPVVGELRVLALGLGEKRQKALADHIHLCTAIPSDHRVVDQWARLYARLRDQLKGGGVNDMWVAACCLVHDLPLVTHNLSDFQTIQREAPGLRLVLPDLD